jgi:hypothetical protein
MKNSYAFPLTNETNVRKNSPADLQGKSVHINENLSVFHLNQKVVEKVSLTAICTDHVKFAFFFDATGASPGSVRLHILQHTDDNLISKPGTNLIIGVASVTPTFNPSQERFIRLISGMFSFRF